jgi:hypothetical protein
VCRHEHGDVLRYLCSVLVSDLEVHTAEQAAVRGAHPAFEESRDTASGDRQAARHGVTSVGYADIGRPPERLQVDPDRPVQQRCWRGWLSTTTTCTTQLPLQRTRLVGPGEAAT